MGGCGHAIDAKGQTGGAGDRFAEGGHGGDHLTRTIGAGAGAGDDETAKGGRGGVHRKGVDIQNTADVAEVVRGAGFQGVGAAVG